MPDRLACDRAMNLSKVRLRVYDPDLKNGEVMKTQVGPSWSPWGLQGGFAVVYKFRTYSGKIRALRCYLTPMKPDIQYRYERIGAYFARHIPDITAEFKYHNDGILIDEQSQGNTTTKKPYSLIEMEWIEGTTLPEYVARLCQQRDQTGLGDIVDQWVAIIKALRHAQIAHCDLAGGNIMVRQNGRLVLVDYDGVYIPDFAGMAGVVDGQADYQHPDVAQRPFNEQADTFSFMVIYAALLALHLRPELWQKYAQQDSSNKTLDTNLLFKKQDFLDPGGSRLFSELETINDTRLGAVMRDLKQACRQPVTQVQLSPYIGDPEKEALDKLEQAIQQDDDEEIVRAWQSTLLDTYEPAQQHRARFEQAQDMVRKIEDFRDAVQSGLMQQMVDRYDPDLDHCKNIKPEERDLLRLARTFREAYRNDDDDMLNAVWDEILTLNYSASFRLTWQETQRRDLAQQRQEAFIAFQKALASKKAQSIVDAYDPVLDSSPRISAEERDTLDLAEEFTRAYRSDDDERIIDASERLQQSPLSWRIAFTSDERKRISLARLRLAALEAFRQALLKKDIEAIVGAYDQILDTLSTISFEERQLLQAAQRFAQAYEQHDDQEIVASSEVITQSYSQSLLFTPEQEQRIEQARRRVAMLEKLRRALASKSIEQVVDAYHPIMEVSKSISSDERQLLTWALDFTQGCNEDDDEAIVRTWDDVQNSSHRYAFALTLEEEQRLSLAQQRVTALESFRNALQTSSREAEKIISAYDAVLDDCTNVTVEERTLLQAAHYFMNMYKAVLEGIQNDNDQQIYSVYDEMIARQFADFTKSQQERINRALRLGQLDQILQNNHYGSAIRLAQELELETRKQIIDFRLTLARKRFITQFEVNDIKAWRINDEVVARWTWPADDLVRYAIIVWRTDRWPQGPHRPEPGTGRELVIRGQKAGELFRFKADLYMAVYLQIYLAMPDFTQRPTAWFYSDGIDPGSKTEAYYSGPATKVI